MARRSGLMSHHRRFSRSSRTGSVRLQRGARHGTSRPSLPRPAYLATQNGTPSRLEQPVGQAKSPSHSTPGLRQTFPRPSSRLLSSQSGKPSGQLFSEASSRADASIYLSGIFHSTSPSDGLRCMPARCTTSSRTKSRAPDPGATFPGRPPRLLLLLPPPGSPAAQLSWRSQLKLEAQRWSARRLRLRRAGLMVCSWKIS
mmetsp:Transcript_17369/g.52388  ORF Transcript_17369/g.52388 Transcript_17369/m.52388 type:complete len:200 (+) Transcript_17369:763-1362(+)